MFKLVYIFTVFFAGCVKDYTRVMADEYYKLRIH